MPLRHIPIALFAVLLLSCEKELWKEERQAADGNLVLAYRTDSLRKMNVQLFRKDGSKLFDHVQTQTADDAGFGRMVLNADTGRYVLVAVGHSSAVSASIKTPQQTVFTAKDGRKLTDTFCSVLELHADGSQHFITLPLQQATACVSFCFSSDELPYGTTALRFDYTGGSANVNPSTLEGCTHSTQTELRAVSSNGVYEVWTFPYMARNGVLKVTVNALDARGAVLYSRTLSDVPVYRGRMTTITGLLLSSDTGICFLVDSEWDGEYINYY